MLVVDELFDAEDILSGVLFIKHIRFQRVQLGLRNGLNAVVEAVNQHIAVFIAQRVQRLHQVPDGAGHNGRVHRVRVLLAHLGVQLHIQKPFHAHGNLGRAALFAVAALPHIAVALNHLRVRLGHAGKVRAAGFFFAFKAELHVQRQLAVHFLPCIHRTQAGDKAVFVVGHAAGINDAVADIRRIRRGNPLVNGVYRLHVVMVIETERAVHFALDLAVNKGAAAGLQHGGLHTQLFQLIHHHAGHLFNALTGGGHAGLPAETQQKLQVFLFVLFNVVQYFLHFFVHNEPP